MPKNIYILLLIILFWSCQTVVDFPIAFENKLVIHGLIRPANPIFTADSILISLGSNSPVVGGFDKIELTNALIKLKGRKQEVLLPILSQSTIDITNKTRRYGITSKDFLIEANETYTLSVETPSGLKAQSSCVIPAEAVEENKIKITILEKTKDTIRCKVNWEDIPNESNFYNVSIVLNLVGKTGVNFPSITILRSESESIDGMLTTEELTFSGLKEYDMEKSYVFVAIANIEENLYNWGSKQIAQQRQNDSNLFPEPVFLKSNINGGLGIFSGYNATYILKPL